MIKCLDVLVAAFVLLGISSFSLADEECIDFQKTFERIVHSKDAEGVSVGLDVVAPNGKSKMSMYLLRHALEEVVTNYSLTSKTPWVGKLSKEDLKTRLNFRFKQKGCDTLTVLRPNGSQADYKISNVVKESKSEGGVTMSSVILALTGESPGQSNAVQYFLMTDSTHKILVETLDFPAGPMQVSTDYTCDGAKTSEQDIVGVWLSVAYGSLGPSMLGAEAIASGVNDFYKFTEIVGSDKLQKSACKNSKQIDDDAEKTYL